MNARSRIRIAGGLFAHDGDLADLRTLFLVDDGPLTFINIGSSPLRAAQGTVRRCAGSAKRRTVTDRYVVGLDLAAGREVHVDDAPVLYWYSKGYSGDHSLVCLHCYEVSGTMPGAIVPLVVKGKLHGKRRPYFAHPAHAAPVGGHRPESVWHAEGKQLLASWARGQAGSAEVVVEYWTADRRRRSDVAVRFADGSRVAMEVQYSPLPDAVWLRRHHDYAALGIHDLWFWHARLGPQRIVLEHGKAPWTLDVPARELGALLGQRHEPDERWWQQRPETLTLHHPPCPADDITIRRLPLSQYTLTAEGLLLPPALRVELDDIVRVTAEHLDQARSLRAELDRLERDLLGSTRSARPASQQTPSRVIACK